VAFLQFHQVQFLKTSLLFEKTAP